MRAARRSRLRRLAAAAFLFSSVACTPRGQGEPQVPAGGPAPGKPGETSAAAQLRRELEAPPVNYMQWRGTSFGAFLAPRGEFWDEGGGVDVVVHFNAAMMAGKEWTRSHANAVIVSAAFGSFGSGPYQEAMADPGRFGRMLSEVVRGLEAQRRSSAPPHLHVRKLGLVAWSAGFGAVGRILQVPRYFEKVDSVVLLDAMQAGYKDPARGAGQGPTQVSLTGIEPYIRFAREAKTGKKQMIITHTSIVPPQYASTTDAALALLGAVGVERRATEEVNGRNMVLSYRADAGDLHVLGYRGGGPDDHMRHLFMVGDVAREHIVPRWLRKPSAEATAVNP